MIKKLKLRMGSLIFKIKVLILFSFTITFYSYSQDNKASLKIDSLRNEIQNLEKKKIEIEGSLKKLNEELNRLIGETARDQFNSQGYLGYASEDNVPIFEDTESYKVVKKIDKGDPVRVLGYKNEKLFVDYEGFFGFIHPFFLEKDSLIASYIVVEKEEEKIQEELKRKELAETARRERIQRQKEYAVIRNEKIRSLYSGQTAQNIIDRKIWIGMTKNMTVLSVGSPLRINRTVTAFGTREQWVYDSMYLYFEDGILTSFQD